MATYICTVNIILLLIFKGMKVYKVNILNLHGLVVGLSFDTNRRTVVVVISTSAHTIFGVEVRERERVIICL